MPVYTRNGDNGLTDLYNSPKKNKKSSLIFEVLGTIDELSASLGHIRASKIKSIQNISLEIQKDLFLLGSAIADESGKSLNNNRWINEVKSLEEEIDHLSSFLEPLGGFVLPGGCSEAVNLHVSRTICRRLERVFVEYADNSDKDNLKVLLIYLNRLSDLLFVMAGYSNFMMGSKELLIREAFNSN